MKLQDLEPKTPTTLKYLLATYAADVDIFLLMEADQETDKKQTFTVDEVRNQLMASMQKIVNIGNSIGINFEQRIEFKMPILGNTDAINKDIPKKQTAVDIEEKLLPGHSKLIVEDDLISANILDAEMDIIHCEFNNDDTVTIKTDGLSYIMLTQQNLNLLSRLIKDSNKLYSKMDFSDDKF